MYETITSAIKAKLPELLRQEPGLRGLGCTQEMLRADIIFDGDLNPYLMEFSREDRYDWLEEEGVGNAHIVQEMVVSMMILFRPQYLVWAQEVIIQGRGFDSWPTAVPKIKIR